MFFLVFPGFRIPEGSSAGLWRIRNITVSGYESDGEEGVLYRRFVRELRGKELEDERNGLWEESMDEVRKMAEDVESEGSGSEVGESGMAIDKEEEQNEGEEEDEDEEGEEEVEGEVVEAGNEGISGAVGELGMLE